MNSINQNLPLFKNMEEPMITDSSNIENVKSIHRNPLSEKAVHLSKSNIPIIK